MTIEPSELFIRPFISIPPTFLEFLITIQKACELTAQLIICSFEQRKQERFSVPYGVIVPDIKKKENKYFQIS